MSQRPLNSGQIHTRYLHVAVLASAYILLRAIGGDPEDAGFFALLIASALRLHRQTEPSL